VIPSRAEGTADENGLWRRVVSLDETLLLLVRRSESRALTRAMCALTHLGDTSTWVVIGLLLGAAGGRGPRYEALLGLGAGLAALASHFLKRACCRPRPTAGGDRGEGRQDHRMSGFAALIEIPDAFSFPSGHTAAAFAIAVALAGEGHGLGPLTLSLASGIGLSRVYLGAHYPLDVAAGVGLGALSGLAARFLITIVIGIAFPGLV
jgi:undecaprenyl-diphosphatase